jgi:hypothetical protein
MFSRAALYAKSRSRFNPDLQFLVGRLIVGVLYDYFRAPDAKTAERAMDSVGGPCFAEPPFDVVETKSVDPVVVLGQLVAFIRKVPWEPNIVNMTTVWPPPESAPKTQAAYDKLPEDSQWKAGPWLEELDLQVRDTLASVDDKRLPTLAAQWSAIEEFGGNSDIEVSRRLILDLNRLARDAREHGDLLYCWMCL